MGEAIASSLRTESDGSQRLTHVLRCKRSIAVIQVTQCLGDLSGSNARTFLPVTARLEHDRGFRGFQQAANQ
jgi:hypothetical protein